MTILCSKILKNDEAYAYLLSDQKTVTELLTDWYLEGNGKGASYLLIARDIPSNENYPVFVYNPLDLKKIYKLYHTKQDSLVVKVFDLNDKRNEDLLEKKKKPIS